MWGSVPITAEVPQPGRCSGPQACGLDAGATPHTFSSYRTTGSNCRHIITSGYVLSSLGFQQLYARSHVHAPQCSWTQFSHEAHSHHSGSSPSKASGTRMWSHLTFVGVVRASNVPFPSPAMHLPPNQYWVGYSAHPADVSIPPLRTGILGLVAVDDGVPVLSVEWGCGESPARGGPIAACVGTPLRPQAKGTSVPALSPLTEKGTRGGFRPPRASGPYPATCRCSRT